MNIKQKREILKQNRNLILLSCYRTKSHWQKNIRDLQKMLGKKFKFRPTQYSLIAKDKSFLLNKKEEINFDGDHCSFCKVAKELRVLSRDINQDLCTFCPSILAGTRGCGISLSKRGTWSGFVRQVGKDKDIIDHTIIKKAKAVKNWVERTGQKVREILDS